MEREGDLFNFWFIRATPSQWLLEIHFQGLLMKDNCIIYFTAILVYLLICLQTRPALCEPELMKWLKESQGMLWSVDMPNSEASTIV